jgi:hypothetical protein
MRFKRLFLGFLVSGIAFILLGLYLGTIHFAGSYACQIPELQLDNIQYWLTPCLIGRTSLLFIRIGISLLVVALIIGLTGYFSGKRRKVLLSKSNLSSQQSLALAI